MSDRRSSQAVDLSAILKVVNSSCGGRAAQPVDVRRQILASFLKHVTRLVRGDTADDRLDPSKEKGLSPRMRQTLQCLLQGDAEKQIAAKFKVSRHTIHQYVKSLYKHYEVTSRAELLARWVRT